MKIALRLLKQWRKENMPTKTKYSLKKKTEWEIARQQFLTLLRKTFIFSNWTFFVIVIKDTIWRWKFLDSRVLQYSLLFIGLDIIAQSYFITVFSIIENGKMFIYTLISSYEDEWKEVRVPNYVMGLSMWFVDNINAVISLRIILNLYKYK